MRLAILILCFSVSTYSYAQDKLKALTAPNSPAISILGMQPATVLAPKSFRALEAALLSNFSDTGGIVPDDFGLEFTPYWAVKEGLSLHDYLYPKSSWDEVIRNSSFSLASTQNFMLQDSSKTNSLALGYRTSVYFGSKKDYEATSAYLKNITVDQTINSFILSQVNIAGYDTKEAFLAAFYPVLISKIVEVKKVPVSEATQFTDKVVEAASALEFDRNNKDQFLNDFVNLLDIQTQINDYYEEFKTYLRQRQGLTVDIAYAMFINFPDNDFDHSEIPRQSVWLTPSYRFSGNQTWLTVLGVLRYEWYQREYFKVYFPNTEVYDHNFDYGLAIEGAFNKFSMRFEGIGRSSSSLLETETDIDGNVLYRKISDSDFQYLGTFTYNLTDQIALSYQIGSKFKPVFNDGGTLVSILSLNFGFGGPDKDSFTP